MGAERLDSRAWLCWGLAAMTPLLLSRNPWVLGEVLLIVVIVRVVWRPAMADQGMGWFLRIAATFVVVRQLIERARTRYRWSTRPTSRRLR